MTKPAKTDEVFSERVKAAQGMRTVTYWSLAKSAKLAKPGVGLPLGYIRDEVCRARGLPWLTVIAVGSDTWLPGDAYLPTGARMEMEPGDFRVWWRAMVLQVFATDWRGVECGPPKHRRLALPAIAPR